MTNQYFRIPVNSRNVYVIYNKIAAIPNRRRYKIANPVLNRKEIAGIAGIADRWGIAWFWNRGSQSESQIADKNRVILNRTLLGNRRFLKKAQIALERIRFPREVRFSISLDFLPAGRRKIIPKSQLESQIAWKIAKSLGNRRFSKKRKSLRFCFTERTNSHKKKHDLPARGAFSSSASRN